MLISVQATASDVVHDVITRWLILTEHNPHPDSDQHTAHLRHIWIQTGPERMLFGVQAVTAGVVDGLFSMLASQSIVPIIRCPKVRLAPYPAP